MPATKASSKDSSNKSHSLSVRVRGDLKEDLETTSEFIELSEQDTLRLALKKGLPAVRQMFQNLRTSQSSATS